MLYKIKYQELEFDCKYSFTDVILFSKKGKLVMVNVQIASKNLKIVFDVIGKSFVLK